MSGLGNQRLHLFVTQSGLVCCKFFCQCLFFGTVKPLLRRNHNHSTMRIVKQILLNQIFKISGFDLLPQKL